MFQLTIWSLAPLAAAALAIHTAWRLRQTEDVPGVYAAFIASANRCAVMSRISGMNRPDTERNSSGLTMPP